MSLSSIPNSFFHPLCSTTLQNFPPASKFLLLKCIFQHPARSILATPTAAKLSADEIKRLIDVRWQVSMLALETRNMREFLFLTYTVSDETNVEIVKSNHTNSLRWYGRRASYALSHVRVALTELQSPQTLKGV